VSGVEKDNSSVIIGTYEEILEMISYISCGRFFIAEQSARETAVIVPQLLVYDRCVITSIF
jgi:hypothetical protein